MMVSEAAVGVRLFKAERMERERERAREGRKKKCVTLGAATFADFGC